MAPYADLHLHTNRSDGSDAPARVVERAAALDIGAIAITDHDTAAGVEEAALAAAASGVGFLRGVEISAVHERRELHIVGLGIDSACGALLSRLSHSQDARLERARAIVAKLAGIGIAIGLDSVLARVEGNAVGRMHVAAELTALGITRRTQAAFDRYLNHGCPAYVPKELMPAETAVAAIHEAGGLAFVAHPGLGKGIRKLLPHLLALPFDGIEAYHISHNPGRIAEFEQLAKDRGLLVSGGSDCHGAIKGPPEMGKVRMPLAYYERIRERLA